jgi:ABC-type multidrug transport system ATPase subunit
VLDVRGIWEARGNVPVATRCCSTSLTDLSAPSQGINISGGQKQRLAIARAVYANADVYLLDDPLSALDAKVGRRVFWQCIKGELKSKTRLLVTNQLQYVPDADVVVVLKNGRIVESGSYGDLMAKNGVLADMMQDVQTDAEDTGMSSSPSCLALMRGIQSINFECSIRAARSIVSKTSVNPFTAEPADRKSTVNKTLETRFEKNRIDGRNKRR